MERVVELLKFIIPLSTKTIAKRLNLLKVVTYLAIITTIFNVKPFM